MATVENENNLKINKLEASKFLLAYHMHNVNRPGKTLPPSSVDEKSENPVPVPSPIFDQYKQWFASHLSLTEDTEQQKTALADVLNRVSVLRKKGTEIKEANIVGADHNTFADEKSAIDNLKLQSELDLLTVFNKENPSNVFKYFQCLLTVYLLVVLSKDLEDKSVKDEDVREAHSLFFTALNAYKTAGGLSSDDDYHSGGLGYSAMPDARSLVMKKDPPKKFTEAESKKNYTFHNMYSGHPFFWLNQVKHTLYDLIDLLTHKDSTDPQKYASDLTALRSNLNSLLVTMDALVTSEEHAVNMHPLKRFTTAGSYGRLMDALMHDSSTPEDLQSKLATVVDFVKELCKAENNVLGLNHLSYLFA